MATAGAVVTDDTVLAARLVLLRNYGWSERYYSAIKRLQLLASTSCRRPSSEQNCPIWIAGTLGRRRFGRPLYRSIGR